MKNPNKVNPAFYAKPKATYWNLKNLAGCQTNLKKSTFLENPNLKSKTRNSLYKALFHSNSSTLNKYNFLYTLKVIFGSTDFGYNFIKNLTLKYSFEN